MNSIGIDLGTTNSVACTIQNGKYKYLQFHHKELLRSSILYKDGTVTVGEVAKRKAMIYSENYISSSKTYMGDSKVWKIDDRTFTPVDAATEILREIYKEAKRFFKNDEDIQAVITTPAYFSSSQNEATAEAGKRAGFSVKQILAEPVAAALAYAFDSLQESEKIYVVDLGGGTFDVTLLEVLSRKEYRTVFKDGDTNLGGDDFDDVIIDMMKSHIRQDIGIDLSGQEVSGLSETVYGRAVQKLAQEAEKVKCSLSESERDFVSIVNLFPYMDGNYDFDMEITRAEFLAESSRLIRRIKRIVSHSIEENHVDVNEIDRVILVGGSSNMPFVREFIKDYFNKEPYADKDLSKLVAMGAAIRADSELGDTITLHDIIAHSLGIELIDDRYSILLEKGREYPCRNIDTFTTAHDYQEKVNISVFEGEDTRNVNNNKYYGGFTIGNIEKALQGVPQIEVTFEFDKSCILHVSARDLATGSSGETSIHMNRSWDKKEGGTSD